METLHSDSWLTARNTLASFNVGWRRLNDWTERGLVKSVKLDESQSGRRLYSARDLARTLDTLAAGRKPRARKVVGK